MTPDERSDRAESALSEYLARDGEGDPETALTDLLADLRHYAERESIDFDRRVSMSEFHYEAEKEEA